MSKKVYVFIITILLIIIALLCLYIFIVKNNKNQNNESIKKETTTKKEVYNTPYTFNDIYGFYTFSEQNKDSSDSNLVYNYSIYLWEDGTFRYQFSMNASNHVIGNYTIINDEIHLNYLFEGGNDAGIKATSGEKVLKIIDKDTLEDSDAYFSQNSNTASKNIKLKKDTSRTDNFDEFNVNKIINNYEIENNANKSNTQ